MPALFLGLSEHELLTEAHGCLDYESTSAQVVSCRWQRVVDSVSCK